MLVAYPQNNNKGANEACCIVGRNALTTMALIIMKDIMNRHVCVITWLGVGTRMMVSPLTMYYIDGIM
jgi:hypothetical protein